MQQGLRMRIRFGGLRIGLGSGFDLGFGTAPGAGSEAGSGDWAENWTCEDAVMGRLTSDTRCARTPAVESPMSLLGFAHTLGLRPALIGRCHDLEDATASPVAHAREDACGDIALQGFGLAGESDDGGKASRVPMVEDLEELLARPRRGALRTEVVQDEERSRTYFLKALIETCSALGAEGHAQMIEQVRRDDEEHRATSADPMVGDRSREMRFAAPMTTDEDEPTGGRLGIATRGLECLQKVLRLSGLQLRRAWIPGLEGPIAIEAQAGQLATIMGQAAAIIQRRKLADLDETHLVKPRPQPIIEIFKAVIGGKDRW